MSAEIHYYFYMPSPWAYIGHDAFHAMAKRTGARIVYKMVRLPDVFAASETAPLAQRHPTRRAYRMLELQRWREKRGLTFNLEPKFWPFDAVQADSAAIATSLEGGDVASLIRRMFSGVWEREENLADADAIRSALVDVGLDADAILRRSRSDEVAEIYAANTKEASALGVFGVPAYVLNGEWFWGQDRIDLLEEAITSGRAPFSSEVG